MIDMTCRRAAITYQLVYLLSRRSHPQGRRALARWSGLGEITVRQELERLRASGLVEMGKQGTWLTPSGRERFGELIAAVKAVEELSLTELALDRFNVGALLAGVGLSPRTLAPSDIWRYRDLAVQEGASGAILIVVAPEGLKFCDSGEPLAVWNPKDAAYLQESFPGREEGDLIVLVSGADRRKAHLGLWRIIAEVLFKG